MTVRVLQKAICIGAAVCAAALLYLLIPFAKAQSSASTDPQVPQLNYEFFKARVEPIFLKKRWPDHARCYVCHQIEHHEIGPLRLAILNGGATFWTEEQSRHNFEVVSALVNPGHPDSSLLLLMPLAPAAGGMADKHQGGAQFASKDDPDWKTMEAWVLGAGTEDSRGNKHD